MCPTWLGTANPDYLIFPIDIVQLQAADFTSSQTVSDKQHQNGALALVGWAVPLRAGQQAQDITLPLWRRLVRHEA